MQSFSAVVLTTLISAFLNLATASPAPTSASAKLNKDVTLILGDATIQTLGSVVGAREVENGFEKRQILGRCGIHVTQYGGKPYGIEALVKGDGGNVIGV